MEEQRNGDVSEPEVIDPKGDTDSGIVLAREIFPKILPIVPLHNRPLFPKMMIPLMFEADNLKKMKPSYQKSNLILE